MSTPSMFQYDDGGRAASGFKGDARDCVVRAIAIATRIPYSEVYQAINSMGKDETPRKTGKKRSSSRNGVHKATIATYLKNLGWHWTATMRIGHGCSVHLCSDELPAGRLIVKVSSHLAAVIDGVIHDTHDPSRNGLRCVYGYWSKP